MPDHECQHHHSDEKKRKKRMKCAAYIAAFAIFQVLVIVVFVMVVMKVRTPKFRIGDDVSVQSLTTAAGNSSSSSAAVTFTAPIRIKNNNFGPYKYNATTIYFTSDDPNTEVGRVQISDSKASFMSTKKLHVNVSVSSATLASNSGVLKIRSKATMEGKAEILWIFKKKKATKMDCVLEFDVSEKTITSVQCK
ncbi:hypothetical protein SAY86_000247 [Trapa natans]|uniref:Late embryogenesis abundant protein LEA-2 subgroup domain-containing protein n=1 Tax=Trapa natans TaxID=22666 RepID=A0AAN7MAK2_TRANT|nr:hypothetical protein SAY86_000247 [Trapa natans]